MFIRAGSHERLVEGNYVISSRLEDSGMTQIFTFATPISISPGSTEFLTMSGPYDVIYNLAIGSKLMVKGTCSRIVQSSPLVRRILLSISKSSDVLVPIIVNADGSIPPSPIQR